MVSGRLFLSRRSQKVVAKVNRPCYYGFARYIKAIDTGGSLRGLVFLLTFRTLFFCTKKEGANYEFLQ